MARTFLQDVILDIQVHGYGSSVGCDRDPGLPFHTDNRWRGGSSGGAKTNKQQQQQNIYGS